MCRWFAYLSPTEPCLLEDMLVTPDNSLSKQVLAHYLPYILPEDVAKNSRFNIDGLGLVWYSALRDKFDILKPGHPLEDFEDQTPRDILSQFKKYKPLYPTAYKSLVHPLANPSFLSICSNTTTTVCLAHVRASLPTPKNIPVLSDYNCHPFCRGRYSLMHNGSVGDFSLMKRETTAKMGSDEAAWVKGNTDTETLAGIFYYLLGEETGLGSNSVNYTTTLAVLKTVLTKTINTIFKVQQDVVKDKSKRSVSTLNIAVTDGKVMLSIRFINHTETQPLSLYVSTSAGATLDHRYKDRFDPPPMHPPTHRPTHPPGDDQLPGDDKLPRWLPPDYDGQSTGFSGSATQTYRTPPWPPRSPTGPPKLPTDWPTTWPPVWPPADHGKHVIVASEPMSRYEQEWTLIPKNYCVLVKADGTYSAEPFDGILPEFFLGPEPGTPGPAKPATT